MIISCIYRITSKAKPNKIYVGSAVNYLIRKRGHLYTLKYNKHRNIKLQRHVNKYGIKDILFEILERVYDTKFLISREQYFIDLLFPYFNISKVAGSRLGAKLSEETKRKIGTANKNPSQETRQKMRIGNGGRYKGILMSQAAKDKISEANKGNIPSKETREKISESQLKRNIIPWNKGKKGVYSVETLAKMSEYRKNYTGWKHSQETKDKMSIASLGKKKSREAVEKSKLTNRIKNLLKKSA